MTRPTRKAVVFQRQAAAAFQRPMAAVFLPTAAAAFRTQKAVVFRLMVAAVVRKGGDIATIDNTLWLSFRLLFGLSFLFLGVSRSYRWLSAILHTNLCLLFRAPGRTKRNDACILPSHLFSN